jgi:hypothetical protein
MSSTAGSLTSFKVSVGGGGTPFTRFELVRIHAKAHGATSFTPVETSFDENLVETFSFCLTLDETGTGDHHSVDVGGHFPTKSDTGSGPQVFNTRVGARADKDLITANKAKSKQKKSFSLLSAK